MKDQFHEDFLNYIAPVPREFFPGKRGLDAGCGFGRHVVHAADFGARMVGLDFSEAIRRAREITRGRPRISLVQGDLDVAPFRPGSFDFVYSIGVLHHLPDPESSFRSLLPLVRPGGAIFVWVYSKARQRTNRLLEIVRRRTVRLPHPVTRAVSLGAALVDWCAFIQPYRLTRRLFGPRMDRIALARVQLYARYPFQVVYADWFDRLAAPVRHYYQRDDLEGWARRAGLTAVRISPTGLYGWRLYGEVSAAVPAAMGG
jgi:SAM-dependent methyltransferase